MPIPEDLAAAVKLLAGLRANYIPDRSAAAHLGLRIIRNAAAAAIWVQRFTNETDQRPGHTVLDPSPLGWH